jgi:small conductance mechanosensitive channel
MIAAAPSSPAATPWFHSLDWERLLETYGVPLLAAIVVLLVGMWVARRLSNAMPRATARMGVDPMLGSFLRNVVYAASLVIVVVLAIGTLGVQITPLLAVLGTAGLAVGLALKDSLSNIASGVMLVTLITAAPIINLTAEPTRRVELVIGIGYEDNIQLARDTALALMKADPRVLQTPAPDVVVYELGAHAINLGIRCYVKSADWFGTKVTLLEQLKLGYDKAGINIPYPQQDMHLYLHGKDGGVVEADALVRDKP